MYGLFALDGAVNEDIEIVAAFGGNSDKLLIAAVIVNQCCVSLWGKGRRFLFFLHNHAAVVGRVPGVRLCGCALCIRNSVPTDDLLALIESGVAGKVLACIGNSNRLAMLLEILRGPKTVASLVEKCGFGSTGQVYHHMKPLLAADIVVEDEQQKGVYVIQPHKVQGIIMLLTGISDMVDETYTQGAWETDDENESLKRGLS